jgi:hypothetical protein
MKMRFTNLCFLIQVSERSRRSIRPMIGDTEFSKEIKALADKHDHVWSVSDDPKTKPKTKASLRDRCAKLRHRLRNKIDDLHWQTCSNLCNTFQNIFLPAPPGPGCNSVGRPHDLPHLEPHERATGPDGCEVQGP